NKADVYARGTMTITHYVNDKIGPEHVTRETSIVTAGSMSLSSPYHLIRTLHYIIELNAGDGQCQYSIDSVYITEKERGGPTQEFSSEEILKRMDISGPVAANAEKQLNEIDMNFQKLIDLIGADMKRT